MINRSVGVLCVDTSARVYVGDILRMIIGIWGNSAQECEDGMAGWHDLLLGM